MEAAVKPIVEVKDLRTHFHLDEGVVRAVDGVSFVIGKSKTLGVVGESGCGKSVTAQSILRIIPRPGQIESGSILFHNQEDNAAEPTDLTELSASGQEIRRIRGKEISMIFQEPMTSFSPVHTIGNQINEAIILHQKLSKKAASELAVEMLGKVGIPDPHVRIGLYPHQLSGGMRQRAMIAMALSCNPKLLIADEPTTALDVTIQAQILELMDDLRGVYGMSIMLITHDLAVIAEMADEVIAMYMGRGVEYCDVDTIFFAPKHPYTIALQKSIPKLDRKTRERLYSIKGSVPSPFDLVSGCPFHPRCEEAIDGRCNVGRPPALVEIEPGHRVACYLYHDVEG